MPITTKTFRAYATYRDQRHRLRQDRRTLVDVASSVEEYVDRADWRVQPMPIRDIRLVA